MKPKRPAKIRIRGLQKSFGNKVVLSGLDLDIGDGRSVVVIGGSGSGKSVLLKCILGLLRADDGSILVDGQEVVGLPARKQDEISRKFGMLFQGAPFSTACRSGRTSASASSQGRGINRERAKDVALAKLAQVGLDADVADLFPAELSGGMQKRVALARAIAADPEIIFFDEPTTGLDPIMTDVINNLIIKTTREMGATPCRSPTTWRARARSPSHRHAGPGGPIIWAGPGRADRPLRQPNVSTSSSTAAPRARSRWRYGRDGRWGALMCAVDRNLYLSVC